MKFFKRNKKLSKSKLLEKALPTPELSELKLQIELDPDTVDGYSMIVNLEKCLGKAFNKENVSNAVSMIENMRWSLLPDDGFGQGFEYDFEIIHKDKHDTFIKVVGNLKTALLTMRHAGLISIDETELALIDADKIAKDCLYPIKYNFFELHYAVTVDAFSASACAFYQSSAVENYYGVVKDDCEIGITSTIASI